MRDKKTLWTASLLLLAFGLYLAASGWQKKLQKNQLTSTFSHAASGMQFFYQLFQKVRPDEVSLSQSPLYRLEDLSSFASLAILSPQQDLTRKERENVMQFVKSGGRVLLSCEDHHSFKQILELLQLLGFNEKLEEDPSFANRQVRRLSPAQDDDLFKAQETYAFYSRYRFGSEACEQRPFDCFVVRKKFGRGEVLLLAGLPLMSNHLIHLDDNRLFAFRLIEWTQSLLIDEYHHFYSRHGFWDLLKTPSFGLPTAGMLAGVLLFFFFGQSRFHETSRLKAAERPMYSYHRLNEMLLMGVSQKAGQRFSALLQHRHFLDHLFPQKRKELDAIFDPKRPPARSREHPLGVGEQLVRFHQHQLRQKGG